MLRVYRGVRGDNIYVSRCSGDILSNPEEAFAPDVVEEDGGFDVAEAVFGDFAMAAFGNHRVHVPSGHALRFGRFDAEGFAIEIKVEAAGGAFASTDAVESELLGEIAVRLRLIAIAQPIFAGDRDIEEGRAEIDEGDVEAATIEGDDHFVMFGNVPKCGEKFDFVHAGDEFDRTGFASIFFEFGRGKKDLAARGFGVEHGDANDLRGKGPEAALLADFGAASRAGDFIGDAFAFAKEVFLLGFVEAVEWKSGGFDVENEFGHSDAEIVVVKAEKDEQEETEGMEMKRINRKEYRGGDI